MQRRREIARHEQAAQVRQLVTAGHGFTETFDPLEDAQANLAIIRAAMQVGPPSTIAVLSKRREELIDRITELSAKPEGTLLDHIAEFKARRAAERERNTP